MLINQKDRITSSKFSQKATLKKKNGNILVIDAVILPVSPQELLLLPEGERTTPIKKIYTDIKVNLGDLFIFNNENWRVTTADDWGEYGYYNNRAVKLTATQKSNNGGFIID